MRPRVVAQIVVGLLLALLVTVPRGARAAFEVNDSTWEGSSEFLEICRARLGAERVRLVAKLDYGVLTPADAVLVIHPEVDLDYDEVSAFLRAGGRYALLDDYGSGARLLERFDIQRVAAPARPAHALRSRADLAIAIPSVQMVAGQEQGRHPVVAEVDQLVTNHPTALQHPSLTPVLEIPALGEPPAALAVTGIIMKRGRLFAMGDPSVLINLMLRYPGNRAFASGLVDYLVADDDWGKRGGNLYVVVNRFEQQGSYGNGNSLGNQLLDSVRGVVDFVSDIHRRGLPEPLSLGLAALMCVGIAITIAMSSLKAYRRVRPRYASGTPLVAQGGVAGRAAVLAAPTTHRALAVLELKSGLCETLAARLGIDPRVGNDELCREVVRQGALSERSCRLLEGTLMEMNRAESATLSSLPLRIADGTLERLRHTVTSLLAEASERLGDRR